MGKENRTGTIDKSPYKIIFDIADKIKRESAFFRKVDLINYSYQGWADELARMGAIVATSAADRETIEKPLFAVFCEQLRILGASVSRREEDAAFHQFLGY